MIFDKSDVLPMGQSGSVAPQPQSHSPSAHSVSGQLQSSGTSGISVAAST